MITYTKSNIHWNYYLAFESDLENVARYIEFSDQNKLVYSIELTRLLLSASSEVDVVMKSLCKILDASAKVKNIDDYRKIIMDKNPHFAEEKISISRYGMELSPWEKWSNEKNQIGGRLTLT